jgi:hypothetical protein
VTAALLTQAGIAVFSDREIDRLAELVDDQD